MSDDKDESTKVGLVMIAGVTALVIIGIIGGVIFRTFSHKAPTANTAVAVEEAMIEGPLTGVIAGVIFFDSGKADFEGVPAALGEAVKKLKEQTGKSVVLAGFHDSTGDPVKNAELAKHRAKAVRAAMVLQGVDAALVRLRKPEQTDGGPDLEAARRVEIRLIDAVH